MNIPRLLERRRATRCKEAGREAVDDTGYPGSRKSRSQLEFQEPVVDAVDAVDAMVIATDGADVSFGRPPDTRERESRSLSLVSRVSK